MIPQSEERRLPLVFHSTGGPDNLTCTTVLLGDVKYCKTDLIKKYNTIYPVL